MAVMHSCTTLCPGVAHYDICSECAMFRCGADVVWSNKVALLTQHGDEEALDPFLLQKAKTDRPDDGPFPPGLSSGC